MSKTIYQPVAAPSGTHEMPSAPCPAWCVDCWLGFFHADHANGMAFHHGVTFTVTLDGRLVTVAPERFDPTRDTAGEPEVNVTRDGADLFTISVDEARRFAVVLLNVADLAESDGPEA